MNNSRRWWTSKGLGLGVATTLTSVLGLVAGAEWIQAYPEAVAALGLLSGLLTLVVRYVTVAPLGR